MSIFDNRVSVPISRLDIQDSVPVDFHSSTFAGLRVEVSPHMNMIRPVIADASSRSLGGREKGVEGCGALVVAPGVIVKGSEDY